MRHRPTASSLAAILAIAGFTQNAAAEDRDPRVHVAAGVARAAAGTQATELGTGGGGAATVELPLARAVGVQASGGFLALAEGKTPSDPGVQPRSTGAAFFGTLGVRFHPMRVAGPWMDANAGLAQTGDLSRPAVDTHLGWDFRVGKGRWDVGPFVGYTQIVEPDAGVRPDDAHIVWAGVVVSLGARQPDHTAPPPAEAPPPPPPPTPDRDGQIAVDSTCPAGMELDEGACVTPITIVDDRIVLDDVIHFEFDSPRIRSGSFGLVRRVAQFIATHPDIVDVSIEGHADAVGTDAYNQTLSEARASSTRDMLVKLGVDGAHLHLVGHGRSQLKVQTQGPDRRNRRVEFIVERKREVAHATGATAANGGKRGTL